MTTFDALPPASLPGGAAALGAETTAFANRSLNMSSLQRPPSALCPRPCLLAALLSLLAPLGSVPAMAQDKATAARLDELEKETAKLKKDVKTLKEENNRLQDAAGINLKKDEKPELLSRGVLTLGGVKLRLGGRAEIQLIDSQSESDPVVGKTQFPDPRLKIGRLRLEPELELSRVLSLHSQIDFKPSKGNVLLKELSLAYQEPWAAWVEPQARIGLDDRFIRMDRRTRYYPLLGNAFWRDETIALQLAVAFLGDKRGRAFDRKPQKLSPGAAAAAADGAVALDADGRPVDLDQEETAGARRWGQEVVSPLDFASNPGELKLFASVGNGAVLDTKAVGADGATFNDLVQDGRNVNTEPSVRELGVGVRYARDFAWLGELELLGFYYNDELSDTSLAFLQNTLTVRSPVTGAPLAGYGNSNSRTSYRYGFGAEYFLPAESFLGEKWHPRKNDGLRLAAQWILGKDGHLRRDGWYVQGSYRYSFPERLFLGRYGRSIEPIIRYGVLDTNLDATPLLPGTWDRRQLLLGAFFELTREVGVRVEYAFNNEDTGSSATDPGPGSVHNDELLVELLVAF